MIKLTHSSQGMIVLSACMIMIMMSILFSIVHHTIGQYQHITHSKIRTNQGRWLIESAESIIPDIIDQIPNTPSQTPLTKDWIITEGYTLHTPGGTLYFVQSAPYVYGLAQQLNTFELTYQFKLSSNRQSVTDIHLVPLP